MKTFVITLKDRQSGTLTDSLLSEHVEHLRQLHLEGKLIFCGPYLDNSHAIKIIRASSRQDAERIASEDPFTKQRYYRGLQINEVADANPDNDFLMK